MPTVERAIGSDFDQQMEKDATALIPPHQREAIVATVVPRQPDPNLRVRLLG